MKGNSWREENLYWKRIIKIKKRERDWEISASNDFMRIRKKKKKNAPVVTFDKQQMLLDKMPCGL